MDEIVHKQMDDYRDINNIVEVFSNESNSFSNGTPCSSTKLTF